MTDRTTMHRLHVATPLFRFIEDRVLPGTGIASADFWVGFDAIVGDLAPKNAALLAERDRLQAEIDAWHRANPGPIADMPAYQAFLREIGYLVPEPAPFTIGTANVDAEIATMAGPQLVVPSLNDRFVLNAANARWGSLYDALYGTDALDAPPARPGGYDVQRGDAVIRRAKAFLDAAVPLAAGSPTRAACGVRLSHGRRRHCERQARGEHAAPRGGVGDGDLAGRSSPTSNGPPRERITARIFQSRSSRYPPSSPSA